MSDTGTAGTSTVQAAPRQPQMDWGRGHYERTATALLPGAEAVVRAAGLRSTERVVDVGCGTGSVALLAARAGARVTGVDPSPRLLEVAMDQADREHLDVSLQGGEAGALGLPDHSADAVLSNFGVIFAPDPAAAVTEMVRVLAPNGRIVFSAWRPGGAMGNMIGTAMDLVRRALGAPEPPTPFDWSDEGALRGLFAAHALNVTVEDHEIAFTADSPEAYLEAERTNHPLAIAGFEVLDRAGQADQARQQLLQILIDGNEDPKAFRTTSRYIVATATGR